MSGAPNAQFNLMSPTSLYQGVGRRARRRMYEYFLQDATVGPEDRILDVGATSDDTFDTSNYLEAWYPIKANIVAIGTDDAGGIQVRYPGVRFVRGDGCRLPFKDAAFDVVHSSAVLEHVGSSERQRAFIRELVRVARRAVHLTTPNRWFPIEFHTQLPLVHWLPKSAFRRLLGFTSRHEFFAHEEHLNLVGPGELRAFCAGLDEVDVEVRALRTFGWPSNLLVTIRKRGAIGAPRGDSSIAAA
jgi:hypothetical protein